MMDAEYDPFELGEHAVATRAITLDDPGRSRQFPCQLWFPRHDDLAGDPRPLIVYSHHSGGNRLSARFLCEHLAGHGYVVAALDHSEVVDPQPAPEAGEADADRRARIDRIVGGRVPDLALLLDHALAGRAFDLPLDASRVGLVGHSFGGWTVLATAEVDVRVGAVVALAPGGNSRPLPGVLPLELTFARSRDVPTLYLAAENDVPIPVDGVRELFDRTPGTKRIVVLRRADHQHFVDDIAREHEALRAMRWTGPAAWIPGAMRPMSELTSPAAAHLFVRGLTLAHFDASLRESVHAQRLLDGDVVELLASLGVEAGV
jgi:dienelactone hydrolase